MKIKVTHHSVPVWRPVEIKKGKVTDEFAASIRRLNRDLKAM